MLAYYRPLGSYTRHNLMEATIPVWHELGIGNLEDLEPSTNILISAKALRSRYTGAGLLQGR